MWRWLAIGAIASCGRVGFDRVPGFADARGDAPAGDAAGGRRTPVVVQAQGLRVTAAGGAAVLPITATAAHDLLVLVTADITSQRAVPAVIDDALDTFTSGGKVATRTNSTLEVWYVPDSRAGATQVALQDPSTDQHEMWLLELADADLTAPLEDLEVVDGGQSGATADAPPVTATAAPAMLVAAVLVSKNITGVTPPFTSLPRLAGDEAAYTTVAGPGTYTAQFQNQQAGEYCAIAAAFRGAP